MTGLEPPRNVNRSGARSFCEPLWLPGWSERSIWGYDEPTGSYFAQLWPDGDDADAPAIWIGTVGRLTRVNCLATKVAVATGHDMASVETALGVADGAST